MQAMPTDISLARPQAFSAATLLILGSGLALYQMTSLMLGPAGSRQLDLSLSLPTLETHELAESPAASGAVIGNLVIPVPLASGSSAVPAHRATSRTAAPPKTTSVAPAPVVAPPSVVTVPPVAPQDAHPERHPLPVVTVPQPERDDEPD
jgi:hypothetical protein